MSRAIQQNKSYLYQSGIINPFLRARLLYSLGTVESVRSLVTACTILIQKDLTNEFFEPEQLSSFPIQNNTFEICGMYKITISQAWISLPRGQTLPQMLIASEKMSFPKIMLKYCLVKNRWKVQYSKLGENNQPVSIFTLEKKLMTHMALFHVPGYTYLKDLDKRSSSPTKHYLLNRSC